MANVAVPEARGKTGSPALTQENWEHLMSLQDDIAALTGTTQLRWNAGTPLGTPTFVTYSFPTIAPPYEITYAPQSIGGFAPLGEAHKIYVRMALDIRASVSGIRFLEVPAAVDGQIRFSFVDFTGVQNATGAQASGFAHQPTLKTETYDGVATQSTGTFDIGGDVFINPAMYQANAQTLMPGVRGFSIVLHEIGHALGFKHPFEGTPTIDPSHDSGAYTIMSYNRPQATTTPGTVDIAATQLYYGTKPYDYSWDPSTLSLTVNGTTGGDTLLGTELGDTLRGGAGSDRLLGRLGNDMIDGGAGTDWAEQSGLISQKQMTRHGDGSVHVVDPTTGEADNLINIERIKFLDGIVAFDFEGPASSDTAAGIAYRLYQAAFDRTPDLQGLSFWVKWLDDGKTDPWNMAARFVDSAEFEAQYGSRTPEDADFMTKIYQNVLDREPEQGGFDWWLSRLSDDTFTQSEVLARFSDSDENRLNVADDIRNGIALSNDYYMF